MSNLLFYDAAWPPSPLPTGFDGVAFYIGGDTPHVWTLSEIEATGCRFRLPIFVRSDPTLADAANDVAAALAQLQAIGAPKGCLVALDSETSVDPNYVSQFYYGIRNGGYQLIDYGSQSTVFGNQIPDGYYWGADWTNVSHLIPGDKMTQWESLNSYDESTALATLPFWDTHASEVTQVLTIPGLPGHWAVVYFLPTPNGDTVAFGIDADNGGIYYMKRPAGGKWPTSAIAIS